MERTIASYPPTRYMGSKTKIAPHILEAASELSEGRDVPFVDLFSGSGIVSYAAKLHGFPVVANDFLAFASTYAQAMVENSETVVGAELSKVLLKANDSGDEFVSTHYADLYYDEVDCNQIDCLRTAIRSSGLNEQEQAVSMTALIRACVKKRPRGVFTFTGLRYDDGRRDLKLRINQHFEEQLEKVNRAVFDNGKSCHVFNTDYRNVPVPNGAVLYVDPPYYSPSSDNHYVRRYHFIEGLARDWKDVEVQAETKTRKIKNFPTPFSTQKGATEALREIIANSIGNDLIISYGSNSLPDKQAILAMFESAGRQVTVREVDHRYSFSTRSQTKRNMVSEYLFISPKLK